MSGSSRIGVVYSPWVARAADLAGALAEKLDGEGPTWVGSVPELEAQEEEARGFSLLVTVGGDGTILRAVRVVAPVGVPIVGVNMGRVGYLTEMDAAEAPSMIATYAHDGRWVEERAMLEARVVGEGARAPADAGESNVFHALNDAVIGRGTVARLSFIQVRVNGLVLADYAADAVIVATATGSTGYALSAGGPILYPESESLLVKPVAPQLATDTAVVLRPGSEVDLAVWSDHGVMLTLDGYVDLSLDSGDRVHVRQSPYKARFLRSRDPGQLPDVLVQRLSSARQHKRGDDTTDP